MIDEEIKSEEFTIVEVNGATGIKFDSGEFAGVIISLGEVKVEYADDDAILSYNYDVVWDNEVLPELLETVEFKNCIGDVLMRIIYENLKPESDDEFEQMNS